MFVCGADEVDESLGERMPEFVLPPLHGVGGRIAFDNSLTTATTYTAANVALAAH